MHSFRSRSLRNVIHTAATRRATSFCFLALSIAAPLALSVPALAVDNVWKVAAGKWDNKDNWDLGHVPKAGETAIVAKGSPTLSVKVDPKPGHLRLGGLADAPPKFELTDNAELTVSGTIVIGRSAVVPGSEALLDKRERGHLVMKGKKLNMNAFEIGRAGFGYAALTSGNMTIANGVILGKDKGSYGAWTVLEGQAEAKSLVVGKAGEGDYTHLGGVVTLTSPTDALSVAVNDVPTVSLFTVGGTAKLTVEGSVIFSTKGKSKIRLKGGEVNIGKELRTATEAKGDCNFEASLGKLTVSGDALFGGLGETAVKLTGDGAEWNFKKSFVIADGKNKDATRSLEVSGTSKLTIDGPCIFGRNGTADVTIENGDHKFNDDLVLAEMRDGKATLAFSRGKVTVAKNLRIGDADGSQAGFAMIDLGKDFPGEKKAELSIGKKLVGAKKGQLEVILRNPKSFTCTEAVLDELRKFEIKGNGKVEKNPNVAPNEGPFVSMADGATIDPGLDEHPFGLIEFGGSGELDDTLVICDIGMPIVEFDAEGGLEKHTEPGVTHDAVIFDESVSLDHESVTDGSTIAVIFNPPVSGVDDERFGVPYDLFFAVAIDGVFNVTALDLPPGLGLKVEQFDGLVRVTLSNEFEAAQP